MSRGVLIYDPARWYYANSSGSFPQNYNWLETPEKKIVNGRDDAFSQTIGEECEPYPVPAPNEAYLPMENIGIVSNGRCGSSCAVFTVCGSISANKSTDKRYKDRNGKEGRS